MPGGVAPPGAIPRAGALVLSTGRRRALRADQAWRYGVTAAGGFSVLLVVLVVVFLAIRAWPVFTTATIGAKQFFTSFNWQPDANVGGGFGTAVSTFGALSPIFGSLAVVGLSLLLAVPLSISLALVVAEANPVIGDRYLRPAVELFVGIPSVVYGYLGFTILLPLLKPWAPPGKDGSGILAAGIVLAIMVMPTITSLAVDGLHAVPRAQREASMALGATQWQTMRKVLIPGARVGIISGIVLGFARAMGETLAVALVIGDVNVLATSKFHEEGIAALILAPFTTMTVAIADGVQNVAINPDGSAARYMLSIVLLAITFACILIVRVVSHRAEEVRQ